MIKKLIWIFLLLISVLSVSAEENLYYLYFYQDTGSETNKISYEVQNKNIQSGDIFQLQIDRSTGAEDICKKQLNFDSNAIFKKITCEVPKKYNNGNYAFISQIIRDGEVINEEINVIYISEDLQGGISFTDLGTSTLVTIDIKEKSETPLTVESFIPKEVIESLTEENKYTLISSDLEYKILEEDPLIAWTVDKAPTQINYTINKKVDTVNQKDFKVEIKEDNYLKNLKYIIVMLIVIILIAAFKPLYSKKSKK